MLLIHRSWTSQRNKLTLWDQNLASSFLSTISRIFTDFFVNMREILENHLGAEEAEILCLVSALTRYMLVYSVLLYDTIEKIWQLITLFWKLCTLAVKIAFHVENWHSRCQLRILRIIPPSVTESGTGNLVRILWFLVLLCCLSFSLLLFYLLSSFPQVS